MTNPKSKPRDLTGEERARRKRYLSATLITCVVLLMIGGSLHVVKLGANRMADMRNAATYDLKDEAKHIRAQGEDIVLHAENEANKNQGAGYTMAEADDLLSKAQWAEFDTMIKVPAGTFTMGTNSERADAQDQPQHSVKLPTYWIDKYPVTNAQYARFVAATHRRPPSSWKNGRISKEELLHPVTMVSWYDAEAYAKWAGKRLPTEAEWEKAGRGTDGRRWPWGNKMDPKRLNTYFDVGSVTNVNAYPNGASPYGVMDLSGDVDEWTADDFAPYPGTKASSDLFKGKVAVAANAQGTETKVVDMAPVAIKGKYKVLRGGSWNGDPFSTSLYHRAPDWANFATGYYGFRCASDAPVQAKGK